MSVLSKRSSISSFFPAGWRLKSLRFMEDYITVTCDLIKNVIETVNDAADNPKQKRGIRTSILDKFNRPIRLAIRRIEFSVSANELNENGWLRRPRDPVSHPLRVRRREMNN